MTSSDSGWRQTHISSMWKRQIYTSEPQKFILWVYLAQGGWWVLDVMKDSTERIGTYQYTSKEEAMTMGELLLAGLL